jgi:hypothetical protein
MSSSNVSVVLVHGAWADGPSWAKITGPLAADEREIVADIFYRGEPYSFRIGIPYRKRSRRLFHEEP